MEQIFQKIPFLRISIFLASGIVIQQYVCIPEILLLFILVILFILLIFLHKKYRFAITHLYGLTFLLFMVFAGYKLSYTYNTKPAILQEGKYYASILEYPEQKTNSLKTLLNIKFVKQNDSIIPTNETVVAYFNHPNQEKIIPGKQIIFTRNPQVIRNLNNPYEFNYQKYMNRKKIYRQVFLNTGSFAILDVPEAGSIKIIAEKIRMLLLKRYQAFDFGPKEIQIISALTLGYKRGLDPEIKRTFSAAGAMHILAVSGLHVGIIFMITSILLNFLRKSKTGRIIFIITAILCLWGFAFITGFSPSVQRAATMFSFVVIGQNLNKQTSVYNSLAASAFILLLLNPNNLFEVGFQLSYSAVFGIVFLQPKLAKIWQPPNKISGYFWSLLMVSVSAQIATFPLAVYYFNQLPMYFWLTNLFIIPAAVILIPSGILLLILSDVNIANEIVGQLCQNLLSLVYNALSVIERLPHAAIQVGFSDLQLALVIFTLLGIFLVLEIKKISFVYWTLCGIILFLGTTFIQSINKYNKKSIIVYNLSRNTVIHLIHGKFNYVISETSPNENDFEFAPVLNTMNKLQLKNLEIFQPGDVYLDRNLHLNKNLLFFNGKWIGINLQANNKMQTKLDFAINCNSNISAKHKVVTQKHSNIFKKAYNKSVFFTQNKGAFYFSW